MSHRWSIIIPVYRHAEQLVGCLRSLAKQTRQPDEIIIVDDGSPEPVADQLAQQNDLPAYQLIRLEKNQGAPAARNAGFRQSSGEIVLFLDADIELTPTAMAEWERAFQEHPEAAFVYNAFRFGWKRFASQPFDLEVLRQTNYIHTSAPIRRGWMPAFDESLKKFQDWDLWLQISAKGGCGVYLPEELFVVAPRDKQSRRWEMSRWLPSFIHRLPWQWTPWQPLEVRRYREARAILQKKWQLPDQPGVSKVARWMWLIAGFELLSAVVVFYPTLNTGVACLLAGLMIVVAYRRPTLGLSVLAAELVIGSKGALFKAFGDAVNDGGVSIRILLFAAFFLGWLAWLWPQRKRFLVEGRIWLQTRWGYLFLLVAIALGVLQGVFHHQPFLVADANAWGFWLALIPLITLIKWEAASLQEEAIPAITAAFIWMVGKTLVLFYLFSHAFPAWFLDPLYLWVRRTGVGEVTRAGGSLFRVFFQSHLYLVFAWLLLAAKRWWSESVPLWRATALWLFTLMALFISLSRSLLLGWAVGLLCVTIVRLGWAWQTNTFLSISRRGIKDLLVNVVGAVIGVALIALIPLPRSDASLRNAFLNRLDQQGAGITSRWQLSPVMWRGIKQHPILGSGFGATLTYPSTDPRIVEKTGGLYTTYAFEWGWLDLWYKVGLVGLLGCLGLLSWFAWRARELAAKQRWLIWSSLLAFVVIHTFTPYFNHPLGIGLLLSIESLLTSVESSY